MKVVYLVEDENAVINDKFEYLQMEVVNYLINNKIDDAYEIICDFLTLQPNNKALKNINVLFNKLFIVINDKNFKMKRDFNLYEGPLEEVIDKLFASEDYFRLMEVLKQIIDDADIMDDFDLLYKNTDEGEEFKIEWLIYYYLLNMIIKFHSYRINCDVQKLYFDTCNNNLSNKLNQYNLSKINIGLLKENEKYYDIDDNHNYYKEFLDFYSDGEFNKAYNVLKKFNHKMEMNMVKTNINYYIKEMLFLLNDDIPEKYITFHLSANKNIENEEYLKAYIDYKNAYNILPNKRLLSKEASCLKKLNRFDEAMRLYIEAGDYISPHEIEELLEILYDFNSWSLIIYYFKKYYEYFQDENVQIDYAALISYMIMGEYDNAAYLLKCISEIYHFYNMENLLADEEDDENTLKEVNDYQMLKWNELGVKNHNVLYKYFDNLIKNINTKTKKYSK